MKIAMVAPTEIPSRHANTIQVMKMAQALALLGHDLRLAAPISDPSSSIPGEDPAPSLPSWDQLASHYGLQQEFPLTRLLSRPACRRYDYALHSLRWARRWDAELLYTRLPQIAAIASQLGFPTILEVHDLPQGTLGPRLFRRFLHGRGAHRLVSITYALAQDLHSRLGSPPASSGPGAFTIIAPDGVDMSRYASLPSPPQARQSLQPPLPDRFTVGYTGHLYPGRGIELILILAARLPEIIFLLIGGEPGEASRLRAQAQALHLSNLQVIGFIPNAALPAYQAACDLLLMPYQRSVAASSGGDISRYLSPMKAFEYMATTRPILSSDLPVLREILNPDNALLLNPQDTDAWVSAIQSLQADPLRCQRLAAQARQDASQYTWETRALRILHGIAPATPKNTPRTSLHAR